jgi:beta-mannosidase
MEHLRARSTLLLLCASSLAEALHHMRQPPLHTVNHRDSDRPLRITNKCDEDIWPAILTQAGVGPSTSGFHLAPGDTKNLTISADWQGRVWGRTNCTFDADGKPQSGQGGTACTTGDCGQFLECQGAVSLPAIEYLPALTVTTGQSTCDSCRVHHVIQIEADFL